jgi:predicted Fe-S protein YdhL (DUF1289 family)
MATADLLAERAREVERSPDADVPSPCISVCRMDPVTELCEGCLRTLDEIAAWGRMEEQGKREVWRLIGQRVAPTPALPRRGREEERKKGGT